MKVTSIKNKLNKFGIKTEIKVTNMYHVDEIRIRGYHVELVATNGVYDFEAFANVSADEIDYTDVIVVDQIIERAINNAVASNVAIKRVTEESDPMSDYCAYSFHHTLKSIERYCEAVA